MKKKYTFSLLSLIFALNAFAQSQLTGTVNDEKNEPLVGVSISVKGKILGTITDAKGHFSLTTSSSDPVTLVFSSVGYQTQEIRVANNQSVVAVHLKEQILLGQEVVVSASRVEENVLKSPVSIEKMDIRAVRETPSATFYDALRNLKGVELSTQGLLFSSVNTRGFTGNGNGRVVQLIDGMDNQAPGLNFPIANIVGISELDLESVELLPGAASALYGPNAINGLLLMNSKSPFLYQGLSAHAKAGVMSASNRDKSTTPYYDVAIRYAKSFNNRLAFKVNVGYIGAQDWQATDQRDMSFTKGFNPTTGNLTNNPNYNGTNIYGDENPVNVNLRDFTSSVQNLLQAPSASLPPQVQPLIAGIKQFSTATGIPALTLLNDVLLPNQPISRTGYLERDLVSYRIKSLKLNASVHYRINDKLEAVAQANWGTGTTTHTGIDRYYIENFVLGQYKLELKGPRFFVRAYTTQERSGDAYAIGTLGLLANEGWKPSLNQQNLFSSWYPQYTFTYAGGALQAFNQAFQQALAANPTNPQAAYQSAVSAVNTNAASIHAAARNFADQGRLDPNSESFAQLTNQIKQRPIPKGAKFLDKTNLYHAEFMVNLGSVIKPTIAEVLVGGNYRSYALNSEGTLFATNNGKEFTINEFGGYIQASRTFAEKLKLTGSIRYDKNQNFDGQFSPRVSAVYTVGNNHNFRVSYQTGFRIPTTQAQYIDLGTPQGRLIGGLPLFIDKYKLKENPSYTLESVIPNRTDPTKWVKYSFPEYKPERVLSFEIGYKALISNSLLIDLTYYNSTYKNYDGSQVIVQPTSQNTVVNYSLPSSYQKSIKTQGFGISLEYLLPRNFNVGANLSNNTLNTAGVSLFSTEKNRNVLDDGFQIGYNSPKYRYNLTVGNRNLGGSGWGFNLIFRHQDAFYWQSSFISTTARVAANNMQIVVPAVNTLDAQISRKIPSIRSIFKIGGSNILQNAYTTGWGNPTVGALYYVSLTFDELIH